ncbi:DNA binding methylated-DNA--cysteine S-methyltransferase [Basidiobolus meristosporus CBS 931.73]|uniref:Methylated-DNA--protein-cysteine methyltransferase n=1 Tax=Basidiobolus meristosporus CBS 931.73 TaxID=1314790 RepID=A0A1Y1Y0K6_9FUNG|nr:DNA binding methylated-DNA--cysteine S-methyltransferase [Basidiobolus meristosporus CBS 931.73]|eukprot:ORX91541.1 DNA binding methylated-DNA--cysteine S-methyltransferase [Basidiobolus meristosporus CBS 931.73]
MSSSVISPYFSKPASIVLSSHKVLTTTLEAYRHTAPTSDFHKKKETIDHADSDIETIKPFPTTVAERKNFLNFKTNRAVTEFQFRVYDLCSQIPSGMFSTYKVLSDVLKSSPRAVGQALRNNPFAPLPIPCHRVLPGTYFIGGYDGDWGSGHKVDSKKARLEREGLKFDEHQVLLPIFQESRLFTDFKL